MTSNISGGKNQKATSHHSIGGPPKCAMKGSASTSAEPLAQNLGHLAADWDQLAAEHAPHLASAARITAPAWHEAVA